MANIKDLTKRLRELEKKQKQNYILILVEGIRRNLPFDLYGINPDEFRGYNYKILSGVEEINEDMDLSQIIWTAKKHGYRFINYPCESLEGIDSPLFVVEETELGEEEE